MRDQLTVQRDRPVVSPPPLPPAVHQPLFPGRDWTGREAVALRRALRMTESKFARSLDVSPRTVSHWAGHPATVPRSAAQDMLDELLATASPAVRTRFGQLTAQQAARSAASSVPAELGAQVVSLGSHPRYIGDFRALACAQVAAARAALGMMPEAFAEWLAAAVGWMPVPGAVEAWEACVVIPPGDAVMAAQACLAGA